MIKQNIKEIVILILLCCLFYIIGNNVLSLTNPDEVFYAQTAKEMAQQKTWMTPYLFGQPQFEKPILLYWFLRIAYIIFGVTAFGARFFPAFFGLLSVLAVYILSFLVYKNKRRAFITAVVFMSAALCIGLSRTVFTDMLFSALILFSLLAFYWGYSVKKNKTVGILFFYIFAGLAVLAKGPLGIIIPFSTVFIFLAVKKELRFIFCRDSLWGVLLFSAIALPWYILMIKKYGNGFTHEFFFNDHYRRLIEAEHEKNDTWYFYPGSMIACMLPWSLFTLTGLFFFLKNYKQWRQTFNLFLLCWLGVVFLIFQPAHSKLVSYIFPLFPVLAIITGDFIYGISLLENKNRIFKVIALITASILLLIPLALIIMLPKYVIYISNKNLVYIFAAVLVSFVAALIILALKFKFFQYVMLLSYLLPLFLGFAYIIHEDIEPYVSSRNACRWLMDNCKTAAPILCSKFYVRSVRFYTDKEVAVIDMGKNFFSPHPIPFLNNSEQAWAYFSKYKELYCVVRRSLMHDMEEITKGRFRFYYINKIGDEYIMKIEPLAK